MTKSAEPLKKESPDLNLEKARGLKDTAATQKTTSGLADQFLLEALYPDASEVFSDYSISDIRNSTTIVVLDTNILLVPYHVRQDDLSALSDVYEFLAKEGRIFLPSRAAREFIKHRDAKLADMIKAINDQKSRLQIPHKRLSPLLEGVAGYDLLVEAQLRLSEARKVYEDRLTEMIGELRRWRGDDPITALYRKLFNSDNIIDAKESGEELSIGWAHRVNNEIPPGYKDSAKSDGGIGDYIIWRSILSIGFEKKLDLVFVTGDEKSDWYVRSSGEAVYPRPELVDEYRRASEGRKFSLMSLAAFLAEMKVEANVVEEIKSAEEESREQDIVFNYPFSLTDLRMSIGSVFPNRQRAAMSDLSEFRDELILHGNNSIDDVARILKVNKEKTSSVEFADHGDVYYTDVGIGRTCFEISDSSFRDIIDMDSAEKADAIHSRREINGV